MKDDIWENFVFLSLKKFPPISPILLALQNFFNDLFPTSELLKK